MPDMNTPNAAGKTIKDYIPEAMRQLLGQNKPQEEPAQETPVEAPKGIDEKAIQRAIETLKAYKDAKSNLESRIVEEERWWKLRHWDVIRGSKAPTGEEARPEPTSAWLFNSLAHKHADIMDNAPEPNVLPREQMDEQDADTLSSILPVIFERNEYEETYSRSAWYKLKHGVAAKGVFWNRELADGLGDIDIRFVDLLNIFWEPGITDLQSSRNLFVVTLRDNDLLEQEYPKLKGKLQGQLIDVKQYVYDDDVDVSDKSLVVDWYYKTRSGGRTLLHYCKFAGNQVLFASENMPEYRDTGYYEHGKYPIEFDVLYPEEGTPIGFGYISIMKSPQMYIDKLSQVILENSLMAGKPRYFKKKGMGINEDDFLDWSKPVVEFEGQIENLQPVEVKALPASVMNMLQMKIDELKETSANRDFNQGGSGGGITSGAALSVLQEAGNKTSRDMIAASYRSYTQECYLAIELIRQFYDEKRSFRITGDTGKYQFVQYDNSTLQGQQLPPAYPGQEQEIGYTPATRKPVFDIVVKPQRRSPYSKLSQNELAKEMYGMGYFNPQLAEQTMTALELMDFDGIEKVRDRVQQGATLMNQMQQMSQDMQKMGLIIQQLTGKDVLGLAQGNAPGPAVGEPAAGGKSKGSAISDPDKMSSYGERLAKNARPSVDE